MKKNRAIIFGAVLGMFSVGSIAQTYIDPLNFEAGKTFDVTVAIIFGSYPSVITNASATVSGTNITIELSATRGNSNALDADITTVSIPPLPDGSYTITTFINGFESRYKKQFSIPYEGFWTPNEIDYWNDAIRYSWDYIGEPALPDAYFSNPTNLYSYALGGNQVNDPNIIPPTLTNRGNFVEYMHPKRKDDDNLTYQVETRTNLTSGTWVKLSSTPTETIPTNGICDEVIYSIPTTNSQTYIHLEVLYQY